jgi:hypothetical protein
MDGKPAGIHEVVRRLNAALGPTLVAAMAGTTDRTLALDWVRHDGPEPDPEMQARLRHALATWRAVAGVEGEHVARQWFIGANPWLGDESPVSAIREDRFTDVSAAAGAMVNDSFSG